MLQDEPAAEEAATEAGPSGGGDVSFPDDYPKSLIHVLMFMSAAISTMCFYAMWTGVGVELKTTDVTPRVIFLPRYVDLLLTQPLLLTTISLISKADTSVLVSLVGYDILMILATLVGAMNVAPFKYMWWFAGLMFLILIIVQL